MIVVQFPGRKGLFSSPSCPNGICDPRNLIQSWLSSEVDHLGHEAGHSLPTTSAVNAWICSVRPLLNWIQGFLQLLWKCMNSFFLRGYRGTKKDLRTTCPRVHTINSQLSHMGNVTSLPWHKVFFLRFYDPAGKHTTLFQKSCLQRNFNWTVYNTSTYFQITFNLVHILFLVVTDKKTPVNGQVQMLTPHHENWRYDYIQKDFKYYAFSVSGDYN